jgi:hypothetical protein
LFVLVREELAKLLNGYIAVPEVVPPELEERAGVMGAMVLAEQAVTNGK